MSEAARGMDGRRRRLHVVVAVVAVAGGRLGGGCSLTNNTLNQASLSLAASKAPAAEGI